MSYINYKSEENSIYVCKGNSFSFKNVVIDNENENFGILNYKNKFNGIKLNDFLSERELDGLKSEEEFKELLEKNNIPFLYIGQGPFGIERSGVLIDQTKSKRADFIINIPDMGTLMFDVKCRTKFGFKEEGEKYFSLFVSELEALHNLQKLILMPVWLAFSDRELINTEDKNPFYFLPITLLHNFWGGLYEYINDEKEFNEIKIVRIPFELLTKINDEKIIFEVGYSNIDKELLKDFAIKNVGFNRRLKDKIKQNIREKDFLKTKLRDSMIAEHKNSFTPNEINYAIENLISNNIIKYEPRKKLTLTGE